MSIPLKTVMKRMPTARQAKIKAMARRMIALQKQQSKK